MTNRSGWFTVDVDGLAALAERRPPAWWLHELIQNGLDEDGVTQVRVQLDPFPGRADAIHVTVTDDAPAGWVDLDQASTMFARSYKATDPEKRGRFNIGEKLFLAICEKATIRSTGGTLHFLASGRRRKSQDRIPRGTIVEATVAVPGAKIPELRRLALMVIAPIGVGLFVNGIGRRRNDLIGTAEGVLPTEIAEEDGPIRRTRRKTWVEVYEVQEGEEPSILEMGIPICAHEGAHHLNVGQVVPLGIERMSVSPRYLEMLYGIALDAVAEELTQEDAAANWVTQGLADAAPESVAKAVETRFGKGAVTHNPKAPESNKEALDAGRQVIPPAALPGRAWDAVRTARETVAPELAVPSSQAFPTGVRSHPQGEPQIPSSEWTPEMDRVSNYAARLASHCLGRDDLGVRFYRVANGKAAWWLRSGDGLTSVPVLSLNLSGGAGRMVEELDKDALDALLIHEMGHELEGDHLSHGFHDALCTIAVRFAKFEGRF